MSCQVFRKSTHYSIERLPRLNVQSNDPAVGRERDTYIALHVENAERTEKLLNSLPKLDPTNTAITPPAAKDGTVALSAEQSQAAKLLGLSVEDYTKTLHAERAAQEAS